MFEKNKPLILMKNQTSSFLERISLKSIFLPLWNRTKGHSFKLHPRCYGSDYRQTNLSKGTFFFFFVIAVGAHITSMNHYVPTSTKFKLFLLKYGIRKQQFIILNAINYSRQFL